MYMQQQTVFLVFYGCIAACLLILFAACSPEGLSNQPPQISLNNDYDDVGITVPDTGGDEDVSSPSPDVPSAPVNNDEIRPRPEPPAAQPCDNGCDVDELCVHNRCIGDSCAVAEDLGALTLSESVAITGSTVNGSDLLRPTCASAQQSQAKEKVYRFSVEEAGQLRLRLDRRDNIDWAFEIRKGLCYDNIVPHADTNNPNTNNSPGRDEDENDPENSDFPIDDENHLLSCFKDEGIDHVVLVEPGEIYYLIVQADVTGVGSFDLSIALESVSCVEGTRRCSTDDQNTVEVCAMHGQYSSQYCGVGLNCESQGCDGGDCCAGDTCANPIVVELTDEAPIATFHGDADAYTNTINFKDVLLLSPPEAPLTGYCQGGNIGTPHSDTFFLIKNVQYGETIAIDISNQSHSDDDPPADRNLNAVFILPECPQSTSTEVECLGFSGQNGIYSWTATQSGDVYVVIDKRMRAYNSYTYRICKGSC